MSLLLFAFVTDSMFVLLYNIADLECRSCPSFSLSPSPTFSFLCTSIPTRNMLSGRNTFGKTPATLNVFIEEAAYLHSLSPTGYFCLRVFVLRINSHFSLILPFSSSNPRPKRIGHAHQAVHTIWFLNGPSYRICDFSRLQSIKIQ